MPYVITYAPHPVTGEPVEGDRIAVATLEEAREAVMDYTRGTVQSLYWDELRAAAKVPSTASDAMTLAAFNQR